MKRGLSVAQCGTAAARALNVTLGELGLIEGGRMVIPRRVLNSLMYHGIRNKCRKN